MTGKGIVGHDIGYSWMMKKMDLAGRKYLRLRLCVVIECISSINKNALMCEVPRPKCITYQKWPVFAEGPTKHAIFSELTRSVLLYLLEKNYSSVLTITFCLDRVEDEVNKKDDDDYKSFDDNDVGPMLNDEDGFLL